MRPIFGKHSMSSHQSCCPSCDGENVSLAWETETFHYGAGRDAVALTAKVPVFSCADCGLEFTDSLAEEIRHEVVCLHLGVLTPAEIKSIRSHLSLSQAQFAELTDIGVASLKRWETGDVIQNKSMDKYLRLIRRFDSVRGLQSALKGVEVSTPIFRTTFSSAQTNRSETFRLRKAGTERMAA